MPQLKIDDRPYPNIQALIFDKDGTLAQSQNYLHQQSFDRLEAVISAVVAQYPDYWDSAQAIRSQILESWGVTVEAIDPAGLMAVGSRRENAIVTAGYLTPLGLPWIEALQLVEQAFDQVRITPEEKAQLTRPIEHLLPELQRLRRSGLKLALLSADTQDNVQAFAQTWDLASEFDLLMGEQPGLPKPNPKLLQLACDRLQVYPSEVLVLGDSAADIQLGQLGGAAGTIGFSAGWPTPQAVPQADQQLSNLMGITFV